MLNGLEGKPNKILERHQEDKIGWLETNLKVDFRSSPEFMRVSLEGDDSDDMEAIIKAVESAYKKEALDRERGAQGCACGSWRNFTMSTPLNKSAITAA